MIRSNLSDYSGAYILVSRTIAINGEGDNYATKKADEKNKKVIFTICAPFLTA